uniref:Uncharacterized protein n=1 Tax=Cafeteria roenbergensis TaxID=33653 RepID=A0A7S0KA00_CAFRO|mmetsp:Transcript_9171/g.35878  ORF Transcript_9171/g.35878 Transcript_9171/m.35878 type:complete len:182 (+) Transcript_9171:99-644(+)
MAERCAATVASAERVMALAARVKALERRIGARSARAQSSFIGRLEAVERRLRGVAVGGGADMLEALEAAQSTPEWASSGTAVLVRHPRAQAELLCAARPLVKEVSAQLERIEALAPRMNTESIRAAAALLPAMRGKNAAKAAAAVRCACRSAEAVDGVALAHASLCQDISAKAAAWETALA